MLEARKQVPRKNPGEGEKTGRKTGRKRSRRRKDQQRESARDGGEISAAIPGVAKLASLSCQKGPERGVAGGGGSRLFDQSETEYGPAVMTTCECVRGGRREGRRCERSVLSGSRLKGREGNPSGFLAQEGTT